MPQLGMQKHARVCPESAQRGIVGDCRNPGVWRDCRGIAGVEGMQGGSRLLHGDDMTTGGHARHAGWHSLAP